MLKQIVILLLLADNNSYIFEHTACQLIGNIIKEWITVTITYSYNIIIFLIS